MVRLKLKQAIQAYYYQNENKVEKLERVIRELKQDTIERWKEVEPQDPEKLKFQISNP